MAELVDALDSGSSRGNSVDVRVILAAASPPPLTAANPEEDFLSYSQQLRSQQLKSFS